MGNQYCQWDNKRAGKRNTEIKTLFGNTCCHTAAVHKHASHSVRSIRKGVQKVTNKTNLHERDSHAPDICVDAVLFS